MEIANLRIAARSEAYLQTYPDVEDLESNLEKKLNLCWACDRAVGRNNRRGKPLPYHSRPWRLRPPLTVEDRCSLCWLFACALPAEDLRALEETCSSDEGPVMHMVIAKGRSLFDQFKYHGSEYRIRIGHHVRKEDGQVGLQRMTRIFPDVLLFQESDPCSKQLSNIPTTSFTTSSSESFAQAKRWINNCDEKHGSCNTLRGISNSPKSWKPARLVRIVYDDGSVPRHLVLDEDVPNNVKYLTLSYCWGPNPTFIRLCQENLLQFRKCISIQDLPLTFREAIQVANELGIVYLWIDALCIIQDSPTDWEAESSQMADIYTYAYVHIAALASADAQSGLFRSRSPASINALSLQVNIKGEVPETYRAVLDDSYEREYAPLARRAWIFQEQTLSTRTLFFGQRFLSWECLECHLSEPYPHGVPWGKAQDSGTRLKFTHFSPKRAFGKILATVSEHYSPTEGTDSLPEQAEPGDRKHMWNAIVEQYTRCELTRAEDKLVALAGIVQRFGRVFKDECWAGMWRKELPSSLLWSVLGDGIRPLQYRAPSWSWASVDGPIKPPVRTSRVMAEVVSIKPNRRPSLYGVGESANMVVKGHLYKVNLTPNKEAEDTYDLTFGEGTRKVTVLATLTIDAPLNGVDYTGFQGTRSIFCLDVAETEHEYQSRTARLNKLSTNHLFRLFFRLELQFEIPQTAIEGLLLEPTASGAPGQYRRIGVFQVGNYAMKFARAKKNLRVWRHSREFSSDLKRPDRLLKVVDDASELPPLEEGEYLDFDGEDRYTCELV